MLQQLIATPSMSSVNPRWDHENSTIIALLGQWLEGLGLEVEILPIAGCTGKANLIARSGAGDEGLVLSGHSDTVPYDKGRWRHDPFVLTEEGGRLYGLGVADMKSFFALVIEAVRDLPLTRLKRPLVIVATADEESTMSGARALAAMRRPLGRYAVIGEPTGLRPIRMHKGIAMEAIQLTGRAGHSSDPANGVSALEGMYTVMGELMAWREELAREYRNPMFRVETPSVNLGHIQGGDNPNRICAFCELHIDMRLLPGMALDVQRQALKKRLSDALRGSGLQLVMKPLFHGTPPMETAADSAIVQYAETLTGFDAEAVAFGTEGPYLTELGMETIIMGPGDIRQAHQPDEYLEMSHIKPAIELIQSLVRRFCY